MTSNVGVSWINRFTLVHLVHFQRSWAEYSLSDALTLSWQKFLSYRNQFIDLQGKSMDWFLYDRDSAINKLKTVKIKWYQFLTHLSNVAFNKETNHLICRADQKTSFYMKCNTGLKWVRGASYKSHMWV